MPDFTNCKRLLGNAYNGANGKKIAIEYQGEQYMVKFPPSGEGKKTELSYINSCISEHIASSIFIPRIYRRSFIRRIFTLDTSS